MSQMGHEATSRSRDVRSDTPQRADLNQSRRHVSYVPLSDSSSAAKFLHSMTASARPSIAGGRGRPKRRGGRQVNQAGGREPLGLIPIAVAVTRHAAGSSVDLRTQSRPHAFMRNCSRKSHLPQC
jgi:hypothetical protein